MTYIHKINPKRLHYTLISLDEFTIQKILFKSLQMKYNPNQIPKFRVIQYHQIPKIKVI
jgi:hypothetical protein